MLDATPLPSPFATSHNVSRIMTRLVVIVVIVKGGSRTGAPGASPVKFEVGGMLLILYF